MRFFLPILPKRTIGWSSLISEYGFVKVGVNFRGEEIYLKKLVPESSDIIGLPPTEIFKKYYPSYYDGTAVKKWIVPIYPEFHTRLFTDYRDRQTMLLEHANEFIVEGNAIKKAYLSHSRIKQLKLGDILLFYRSKDDQSITSIGVIEEVNVGMTATDEIIRFVGKRTVYTRTR